MPALSLSICCRLWCVDGRLSCRITGSLLFVWRSQMESWCSFSSFPFRSACVSYPGSITFGIHFEYVGKHLFVSWEFVLLPRHQGTSCFTRGSGFIEIYYEPFNHLSLARLYDWLRSLKNAAFSWILALFIAIIKLSNSLSFIGIRNELGRQAT